MTTLHDEIEAVNAVVLTPEQEASIDEALMNARDPFDHEVATHAAFDEVFDLLVVTLKTGRRLAIPREDLQGLASAELELVREVRVEPMGLSLWWNRLDQGFTVEGLRNGRYGNERWMERLAARDRGVAA